MMMRGRPPVLSSLRHVGRGAVLLASVAVLSGAAFAEPQETTAAVAADKSARKDTKPAETEQQSRQDESLLVTARRRNQMEVISGGQLGALGTKKGLDVPFNIRSYT
ncbi:MAG: hypothetical protein ABF673_06030, partial [Acetobacter persici]